MIPCYKSVKIVLDKISAMFLIVLLSPIFFIITLLLAFSGNGIFFTQERVGFLGKHFFLYKFKTMKDGNIPSDSARITIMGGFLRKCSLDELPQIWNIIKGDMSFIGPRPLLVEYLPLYSDRHQKRHWVMPGISGLAQVNGRNNLSWEEKFELDVSYQEKLSFWLDIKLIIQTIVYLLTVNEGIQPAEKFLGYNHQTN
jgi:lipopolysaccharide/colanic/teichoic acid biosynthesis glycosyltransferase